MILIYTHTEGDIFKCGEFGQFLRANHHDKLRFWAPDFGFFNSPKVSHDTRPRGAFCRFLLETQWSDSWEHRGECLRTPLYSRHFGTSGTPYQHGFPKGGFPKGGFPKGSSLMERYRRAIEEPYKKGSIISGPYSHSVGKPPLGKPPLGDPPLGNPPLWTSVREGL